MTLLLDSTQLEIVLSATEKALAFRREPVRIDRTHISKVQLVDDPWTWLRGVPNPGTRLRGVVAMGRWRSAGGDDFVVVRRAHAGVILDLTSDAEFSRVVLTTRHGLALVQALRLDTGTEPTDVVDLATGAIPTLTTEEMLS